MGRTRLKMQEISEIVGSDGLSVVVLTDEAKKSAVNIVIDHAMMVQLNLRRSKVRETGLMLPEVLVSMFQVSKDQGYELMIYDVSEGQYKVTLLCRRTMAMHPIRISDAVLLSFISGIPLYMDDNLLYRQSSPYSSNKEGISIPINVIDLGQLKVALEKAIADEDYRLAGQLKKEIDSRRGGNI